MGKILALFLSSLVFSVAGAALAHARDSTSWDGVYSDAQAQRGQGLYAQRCAMCHGAALNGNNEAPPLTGEFMADWDGTTLAQLFDKIQRTMPLDKPGSLSDTDAADILAFVLKANNFPANAKDLSAGQILSTIRFAVHDPKTKGSQAAKRRAKSAN